MLVIVTIIINATTARCKHFTAAKLRRVGIAFMTEYLVYARIVLMMLNIDLSTAEDLYVQCILKEKLIFAIPSFS